MLAEGVGNVGRRLAEETGHRTVLLTLLRSEAGGIGLLAARLCAEAEPGQILVTERVRSAVEDRADFQPLGDLELKGLARAITAYNVVTLRETLSPRGSGLG